MYILYQVPGRYTRYQVPVYDLIGVYLEVRRGGEHPLLWPRIR